MHERKAAISRRTCSCAAHHCWRMATGGGVPVHATLCRALRPGSQVTAFHHSRVVPGINPTGGAISLRIWHACAALNASLTACGYATGPKDIFGSSAVPRFIIPPTRLQRAHTHSVWVSFDQGSHGHRPVTRHSAGMHVGARMLKCACMPTRIRCLRPLSPALPRALDHGKLTVNQSVYHP